VHFVRLKRDVLISAFNYQINTTTTTTTTTTTMMMMMFYSKHLILTTN